MTENNKDDVIVGIFEKHKDFGFVIPLQRGANQRDFFVSEKNRNNAQDKDKVEIRPLATVTGKKPEARIVRILKDTPKPFRKEVIEGTYFSTGEKFGFIEVPGVEKGYFVHIKKSKNAIDGDIVRAELQNYNGKKEAIVFEIVKKEQEIVIGKFYDNEKFGFVTTQKPFKKEDIFIPGPRKNGAITGDIVEVLILKRGGKNPEGVVRHILDEEDLEDYNEQEKTKNSKKDDFETIDFSADIDFDEKF